MIPVEEARRRMLQAVRPLPGVVLAIEDALGLVTTEPLVADRDYPPTDRSAMDGYAVRAADAAQADAELRLTGECRAGMSVDGVHVDSGCAARIFTGAVIPAGADTVVMVEHARESADRTHVRVQEPPRPGQHIRRQGEDYRAGERILPPGVAVHSSEAGALATVGATRVRVRRRPRVAVLSTGDEVVEPQARPAPHQVRNGNALTLLARLREAGVDGFHLGIAADESEALRERLEEGLTADVLIVTGGVSVGEYDLVRESLERLGMKVLFHGVAMRPGKPVLAGRRGDCLVVGLPGNPVSAVTGLDVLVLPALRRMMGYPDGSELRVLAVLDEPLSPKGGRTTFHLGRVRWQDGDWHALAVRSASSGDALSLVRANAYLITPPDARPLARGDLLEVMPWSSFHLRRLID